MTSNEGFHIGPIVIAVTLAVAVPTAAHSQNRGVWLPALQGFAPLLADPHEIRLAAGFAWTDLFEAGKVPAERPAFSIGDPDDMDRDLQGVVSLGGTLPLWASSEDPDNTVVVSIQAGVSARFRLEEPSRDYAASDWTVALPVAWIRPPVSLRARILHRSAHLGDELIHNNGIRRIEFAHEAIDVLVAYDVAGAARVYGGSTWIFRSITQQEMVLSGRDPGLRDNAAVQVGFDAAWPLSDDGRLAALAGFDFQAASRTEWASQLSAAAGLGASGPGGGLQLLLRFYRGTSPLGEFFLTDETFWMLEAVVTH